MEKVKAFVEHHPWGTAAIVFTGGLILLWLLFHRGGKAAPVSDNSGIYGAAAAANASNDALAASQNSAKAATNIASLKETTDLAAISAGRDIHLADTAAAESLGMAEIAAKLKMFDTGQQYAYAGKVSDNNTAVSTASFARDTTLGVAKVTGDATVAGINASRDVTLATLNSNDYQAFLHEWAATERFVASPEAGMTQGTAWGGLPFPGQKQ